MCGLVSFLDESLLIRIVTSLFISYKDLEEIVTRGPYFMNRRPILVKA